MTFEFKYAGFSEGTKAKVYDLWQHKEMGVFTGKYTALVNKHASSMIKLTPVY